MMGSIGRLEKSLPEELGVFLGGEDMVVLVDTGEGCVEVCKHKAIVVK